MNTLKNVYVYVDTNIRDKIANIIYSPPKKVTDIFTINQNIFCSNDSGVPEDNLKKIVALEYVYSTEHSYRDLTNLAKLIWLSPALKEITLNFSYISAEHLKYFLNASSQYITCNREMFHLHITGNTTGDENLMRRLAQYITNCKNGYVRISIVGSEKPLAKTIFNIFSRSNLTDKTLLDRCKLTATDLSTLEKSLTTSKCNVRSLQIQDSCFKSDIVPHIANIIFENSSLQKLVITNLAMKKAKISKLFKALHANHTLQKLKISFVRDIGDSCGQAFAKAVALGIHLRTLKLVAVNMTAGGLKSVAEALTDKNCSLEVLDISRNKIASAEVAKFLKVVAVNKTLQSLTICKAYSNQDLEKSIIKVVTENSVLRDLNLNGICHIGNAAFSNILASLKWNNFLHSFKIISGKKNAFSDVINARFLEVNNLAELTMLSHFFPYANSTEDKKAAICKQVDHMLSCTIEDVHSLNILKKYFEMILTRSIDSTQLQTFTQNSKKSLDPSFAELFHLTYNPKPKNEFTSHIWGDGSTLYEEIEGLLKKIALPDSII